MSYIVCTDSLAESKIFVSWKDSAFLIFSSWISQTFASRFETVSLPYLRDLIICLSLQLFFLKQYEWSLNLKISSIICGAAPLFTLNISVNSTWIFLSWVVTELYLSRGCRKEELLSLKQVSKYVHAACLFDYWYFYYDTSRWIDSSWIATL